MYTLLISNWLKTLRSVRPKVKNPQERVKTTFLTWSCLLPLNTFYALFGAKKSKSQFIKSHVRRIFLWWGILLIKPRSYLSVILFQYASTFPWIIWGEKIPGSSIKCGCVWGWKLKVMRSLWNGYLFVLISQTACSTSAVRLILKASFPA